MPYAKICFVVLLCLFSAACAKQQDVTIVDLAEAQEKPMTAEERISILEGRIDILSSELQTYKSGASSSNASGGGRPNYAANQNSSPDLNSTVHRIVPRPTATTAATPKESGRPSAVKKSDSPAPVSMPPGSTSESSTKNKDMTNAGDADNAPLTLPPETVVAAAAPSMPPSTTSPSVAISSGSAPAATASGSASAIATAGTTATASAPTTTMAGTPATGSMQANVAGTPVATASSDNEKTDYKIALDKALAGKFSESIPLFERFLQNYPSGKYAPNAYYWIGECLYAQKKFPEALLSFKNVATRYPKHHKTADALLKAGMTYDLMGDANNADVQYNALLEDFPSSSAANIVKSWGYVQ